MYAIFLEEVGFYKSIFLYTARKASWNKAGVEPVH